MSKKVIPFSEINLVVDDAPQYYVDWMEQTIHFSDPVLFKYPNAHAMVEHICEEFENLYCDRCHAGIGFGLAGDADELTGYTTVNISDNLYLCDSCSNDMNVEWVEYSELYEQDANK